MKRKIRVMLIDDEISVRRMLQNSVCWDKFFMEIAGEAGSGSEAINIIDGINPDLAFVDIKMPFMNGIEFSKKIQVYVAEHYKDNSLNIATVAEAFGYNASYLGKYYKQKTGRSLLDYILEYRMERAIYYRKQGIKM